MKYQYTIMHKDIEAVHFNKDGTFKIRNENHKPPYLYNNYDVIGWIRTRLIPVTRFEYDRLLYTLNIDNLNFIDYVIDNKGLSLSDCYWIKDYNSNECWGDVNYFDNEFSTDMVNIFLFPSKNPYYKNMNIICPSNNITGHLPKAWTIKDNKRILLKRPIVLNLESYSELAVYKLCEKLGIKSAKVSIQEINNSAISETECVCNSDTELITADDYSKMFGLDEYKASTRIYKEDFSKMYFIDYITENVDRNFENFGFLRNPDTLEFLGFAPLYDHGACLWSDKDKHNISHKNSRYDPFNEPIDECSNINEYVLDTSLVIDVIKKCIRIPHDFKRTVRVQRNVLNNYCKYVSLKRNKSITNIAEVIMNKDNTLDE